MTFSVALTQAVSSDLAAHLIRADGQEDLCFALYHVSHGQSRTTALVTEVILPLDGDRQVHGNASFNASYLERVLALALEKGAGMAFLHRHPNSRGWQGLSRDDMAAEQLLASRALAVTERPLVGLTMNGAGQFSARTWERIAARRYAPTPAESVRVVGKHMHTVFNDEVIPVPKPRQELLRTIASWGPLGQAQLSRLRVGIVGAGSVGSMVAESLARMGIRRTVIIDFDLVQRHNLDRQMHATRLDAYLRRSKAQVLANRISATATAESFEAIAINHSIADEAGLRAALDCDVLFCCVDRPLARYVLNFIAYAHLIPVIDGGIRAIPHSDGNGLKKADWKILCVGPDHQCLECSGQYESSLVSMDREGTLDDPRYISSLPEDHPLKTNQNVFTFSMNVASLEVLQLISLLLTKELAVPETQLYHVVPGFMEWKSLDCKPSCIFQPLAGLGEDSGWSVTGGHRGAVFQPGRPSPLKRAIIWTDLTIDWLSRRLDNFIAGRLRD